MTDATTETTAEWDGTGTPPAPVGDPGSPLPLDHEPVPAFLLGVHGDWHAIPSGNLEHAFSNDAMRIAVAACGDLVRVAAADDDGTLAPWEPAEYPASFGPCPECAWITAGESGDFGRPVASLMLSPQAPEASGRRELAYRTAHAILAAHQASDGEMDSPALAQKLAMLSRHAPAVIVFGGCTEGDCDHLGGDCPSSLACPACSLRAGTWAGEWEGQYEITIPAPCAVLLAIAEEAGVSVPADEKDDRIRELEAEIAGLRDPASVTVPRADLRSVLAGGRSSSAWKRLVLAVDARQQPVAVAESFPDVPEGDGQHGGRSEPGGDPGAADGAP